MSAWSAGDVAGIVKEIDEDYAATEPEGSYQRLSPYGHARMRGFSMMRALAMTPETSAKTGKVNAAATLKLINAVVEAVNVITERETAEAVARASRAATGVDQ